MIPPHPQAPALNFYPRPPRGGRQPGCRPRCRFSKISIHALREEGDSDVRFDYPGNKDFYPRPPRGGRLRCAESAEAQTDFYPRPPRGGRRTGPSDYLGSNGDFYPRPPRGGRPTSAAVRWNHVGFLSTPSARRATPAGYPSRLRSQISIHALREEGDASQKVGTSAFLDFYPRPPRGGRQAEEKSLAAEYEFLSTPSARRATVAIEPKDSGRAISIHALREEGDAIEGDKTYENIKFLSTPSARRATRPRWGSPPDKQISIHALREEGD